MPLSSQTAGLAVFVLCVSLCGQFCGGFAYEISTDLISVYIVGLVILITTSVPVSLAHGGGLPGLIVAMFVIGIGVGGVKATIGPFLGTSPSKELPILIADKSD